MPLRYSMIRQILGGLREVAPGAPCGLNLLDPSRHVFTTWCLPYAVPPATGADAPSTLVSNVLSACQQDRPQPRTETFCQKIGSVAVQIEQRIATLLPPDSQLRAQKLLHYLLHEDAAPALLPENSAKLCQTAVELLACLPMPPFALISGAMYARYLGVTLDSVPQFPGEIGPGRRVSLQGAELGHFDYRAAHYQQFSFRSSGQGTLYYILYVIGVLGGKADWMGEIYHVAPLIVGGDFRGMLFSHLPKSASSAKALQQAVRCNTADLVAVAQQAETWLLQLDQLELSSFRLGEEIDRDLLPECFIEAVTTTRNVHYAVIMDRDRHIRGVWSREDGQGGLASEVPLRKQSKIPAFADVLSTTPQGQAEQELIGETGVEHLITDPGQALRAKVVQEYQKQNIPLRAGFVFNLFTDSAYLFFSAPSQIDEHARQKLHWEWAISAYGVRELMLNRIKRAEYDQKITASLHGATQFRVLIVGAPSGVWTGKFHQCLARFTGDSISFNINVVKQLPEDYADHDLLVGYQLPSEQFDHVIAHQSVPCAIRIGQLTSSNMLMFPVQVADLDESKLLECVLSKVILDRAEKVKHLRAARVHGVAITEDEEVFHQVVTQFTDGRTLDINVDRAGPVKGHQLLVVYRTRRGKYDKVGRRFYGEINDSIPRWRERKTPAVEFLLKAIRQQPARLSKVADTPKPNWDAALDKMVNELGLSGGLLVNNNTAQAPSFPRGGLNLQNWKHWTAAGKVYKLSRSGAALKLTEAMD